MSAVGSDGLAPRLTAIVLNYNGRALLETMLASLAAQTYTDFSITVLDNGSRDDSLQYLAEVWPAVEVLALERNVGVTAALNVALESAAGEYVALFNNDMELEPACIAELVDALDAHPGVGSVTPKMLDFADREVIDGAGDLLSWRGGGTRRGHGERDAGQYDEPQEIFGACGGAAVYRREALIAVGHFDEIYFAYYEDVDWSFRAQLAGFRCRYVPSARLYHRGSATLGRGISDFNGYHLWRNPIWLVVKCFPAGALLRHGPDLLIGQGGNFFVALKERKLRVWLRAIRDALIGLPHALGARRAIQRSRAIDSAQLEAIVRAGRQP